MSKVYISLFFTLHLIFSFSIKVYPQSSGYSQSFTNLLYINPAFAGSKECPRIYTSYRNKYLSFNNAFVDYYISYDQSFYAIKSDIGFSIERDVQGDMFNTNTFNVILAKGFRINTRYSLKIGLSGDILTQKINSESITTPDMIDPMYGFVNSSNETYDQSIHGYFSCSGGLLLFSTKQYFGLNVKNIYEPKIKNTSEKLKYREYLIHFSRRIDINPTNTLSKLITINPSLYIEFNKISGVAAYGLSLNKKKIIGGVWLKQNFNGKYESFVVLVGFVQKNYKFAYSCDVSISQQSGKSVDIHEISYTHYLKCKSKKKRFDAIKAPVM